MTRPPQSRVSRKIVKTKTPSRTVRPERGAVLSRSAKRGGGAALLSSIDRTRHVATVVAVIAAASLRPHRDCSNSIVRLRNTTVSETIEIGRYGEEFLSSAEHDRIQRH